MLGGLIAGALKGAAEGYTTVAKGELENQQRLDYASKILELQEQKELRVDEIRRSRDITDIGRKATATAAAAPTLARGEVDATVAKLDATTESGLPQKQATVTTAVYDADRPLAKRKAADTGEDQASQAVARVGSEGYLDAVAQENEAKAAGDLAEQRLRNQGGVERENAKPPRGGGGGAGGASGDTSLDLERRFKAAERNLAQRLGVAPTKVNEELAYLQRKADRGDEKAKTRLAEIKPAIADWQTANTALRNFTRKPGATPDGGSSERPPLSTFAK